MNKNTLSVREIAAELCVSKDTIFNCIKRIMPNKMKHGVKTLLNETECALISKELKGNNTVLDRLTVGVSATVKSTTTELEIIANYELANKAFVELLNQKIEAQNKALLEQQPKVDFFNAVTDSKTALSMDEVAKLLDNGFGRNKLFEILRENQILRFNNEPYQKYIDEGWFRVVEQKYDKNGDVYINLKTLVFQKGLDNIRKLVNNLVRI